MRVLRTLAVAGIATLASVVNASPIVTVWNYTVTSDFDTTSTLWAPNPPLVSGGALTNTSSLLAWGIPTATGLGNQSSLSIADSPATNDANPGGSNPGGELVTAIGHAPTFAPGEIGLTQTFTHDNWVIDIGSNTLDSVNVLTTLQLQPFSPAGAPLPLFGPLTVGVNFAETPNFPAGGCVDGDPTRCPDIFVISGGLDNAFWYNSDTGVVSPVDPGDPEFVRYFIQIFPFAGTALNPLSSDACAAAGAAFPCQGFKTLENQENEVQFAFSITTQPLLETPEPGILALFALGLVGLGFTVRRRQA